ncbi:hypothetical protein OZ410_03690 [Robiginitalea sp. M366]|uniref:hypothetical protein n=1 Tax=Robiginitalea aestuariiviva TaxID=3036903 RepID=UPI00240E0F46|nr:hypothetical protein [Robiginitalea aestuariiviva]MDG1571403.1 hypothetical protein [Robiginitalea aestuariiviva]
MAVLGRIIKETEDNISIRQGSVIGDVIIEKHWMQIRTYAMGDLTRGRGSKQNIQFDKQKAKELRELLDIFIKQ